ncbi:MAG: hypothetical protein JWM86_1207 [Thermoleophilia bacterium]|nr:hypothetical protein [Thermoleophilia bacterium]
MPSHAASVPPVYSPAAAQAAETLPSGTSIAELLDALQLESPLQVHAAPSHGAPRPHEAFSTSVAERRDRTERRSAPRETPDRRFASSHLAMPAGPVDPRPATSPVQPPARPMPLDTRMPELPTMPPALEPARPYELPSRGLQASTVASTRPNIASSALPFPGVAPAAGDVPPMPFAAPIAAPATAAAAPAAPVLDDPAPPTAAPAPPVAPSNTHGQHVPIESIYGGEQQVPMGRLEPWAGHRVDTGVRVLETGPAGPAAAPGYGLDPVVAAVAAAPNAWFGGSSEVDDAMLVWSAPPAVAPLATQVAGLIAPAGSAAPGAALATMPLAPATAAGAPAPSASGRGPIGALLRALVLLGLPAGGGIGIAIAVNHYLL